KAAAREVSEVTSEAGFTEATKEGSNYQKTLAAGSPEALGELQTELVKSRTITIEPESLVTAQVQVKQLEGETKAILATLNGLEETEKLKQLMRQTRIHMVVEAVLRMERYELYAMLENPADSQNPVLNAEVQEKGLAAVLQLHAGQVSPSVAGSVHHARGGKPIGEVVAAYMVQQYGEVAVRNLIKDGTTLDLPEDEVAEINERLFGIVPKKEVPDAEDAEVAGDAEDAADAQETPVKPPSRPAVISEIYDRNTAEIRMKRAMKKLGQNGAPKRVAMALKERNEHLQRAKEIILNDDAVHNLQRAYLEFMHECDTAFKSAVFSGLVQNEFGDDIDTLFVQIESGNLAAAENTLKLIASRIDEFDRADGEVLEGPPPDHGAMGLTTKSYHTMLNMLVQGLSNVLAIKGADKVLPHQVGIDIKRSYRHVPYQMGHHHETKPLNAHDKMESKTEVEALTPTFYQIGQPPQLSGDISQYLDDTLTYVRKILGTERVERRGFAIQALHNSLKALAGKPMRGVTPAKVVAVAQALMKLSALEHQEYGASPADVRQLQLSLLCAHLAISKGSGKAMTSLEKATLTNLLHQTGYLPIDSETLNAIERDFGEIKEVKPNAARQSQEQIDSFNLLTVLPALFHGHLFRSNDQLLQWSKLKADSVLDSPDIHVTARGAADYKEGVMHQFAEKSHLQVFEIQIDTMKHRVFVEVLEVDRAAVYKGEAYRGSKAEIQFARPTDISLSGESTYSQFMPNPVDYLQKAHLIHSGCSNYYLQLQQISAGPNAFSQLIEWCSDARNYNAIQQYTNIREAVLSKLLDAIHNMPETSITERHINDITFLINTQFPTKVSGSLLKGFQMAFFGKQLLEAIRTKVQGAAHSATIRESMEAFERLITVMWSDLQWLLEDTGERNSRAKVMLAAMRQCWSCVSSESISPNTIQILFNARKAMRESRDRAVEEWRTDLADQELSGLSKESLHLVATAEALYAKREVELTQVTRRLLDSPDKLRKMLGIMAREDIPIPTNAAGWKEDGNIVFNTDRVYFDFNRGLILFDGRTLDGVDERVFEHPLFKQAFGHEPIELEVMQLVSDEPKVNGMRYFYKPKKDEFTDFRIHFDGANNMRITRECDLKLDTEATQVVTLDLVDARRYQGNIPKGLIAGCQCWEIKTEGHPHQGSVVVLNRELDGEPVVGLLVPAAMGEWVYKRVINDTVESTYHEPESQDAQGLMAALAQFSTLEVEEGTMELWSKSTTERRIKMNKAGFELIEQNGRITCGEYTVLQAGNINDIGAATGTLLMQKIDADTGIVQLAALVPGVPLGSKALLFEVQQAQGELRLKPKNRLQRLTQAYHLACANDYEKSLEAIMEGWNESPLSADEAGVMQACVDLALCDETIKGENKNLLKWGTFVAAKFMNHMVLNNHMMKSSGADPEADFMCINMKTLALVAQLYDAKIGKGARLTDAILDKKFHYHQFDMAFRGLIRHLVKYGNGGWSTTLKNSLAAGAGAAAGNIEGYIDKMVAQDRVQTPVEVTRIETLLRRYNIETDVYHGEYEIGQDLSRQQLMMATMADTYSAAPIASLPLAMGDTPISRA
ncbi:MAG: hypothetical protein O3A01_08890, partial [bacterium]|nr:hypothetical protein [bacterium]